MSRYFDVICKKNLNHDHVRHIILFKAFGFNLSVVTLSNMLSENGLPGVCYALQPQRYDLKDVTRLSENAHVRLLEAKAIRQESGGENEH